MTLEYKDNIEELKSKVIEAKASFNARLEDLKKQMASQRNNSEALEELKMKHAKEMAEHVRESNQKYNQLYQDKLDQEDLLKEKFEKEKKRIISENEMKLKQLEESVRKEEQRQAEQEISNMRAEMNVMLEDLR